MVSTFTPNIQLEEPARGDDVGTWDTPVNNNMTLIDKVVGNIATIGLNNSNVTLSAAQFQSKTITFNSTLTGSVIITFPASFTKSYEILNLCSGTSAFTITLATTTGGQVIAAPPGDIIECLNDGSNLKFKNLDRIGAYWDYCGSSIPNWVSACTVAPYLNCDGTSFSSATFPVLAQILGGNTLPDSRGRSRFTLVQTTTRLTSAVAGFNPAAVGAAGGDQNTQAHAHGVNDPGHVHTNNTFRLGVSPGTLEPQGGSADNASFFFNSSPATTGISIQTALAGGSQNIPPAYMGGLTLVRSA